MACPNAIEVNSLYNLSTVVVTDYFIIHRLELRKLPEHVLFDLYFKMYKENRMRTVGWELQDINVFARMLRVTNKRTCLLQCFQSLMDCGTDISTELVAAYSEKCLCSAIHPTLVESTIDLGLKLGGFLSEAGWYKDSQKVLMNCKEFCLKAPTTPLILRRILECYHKLLHAQAAFCDFSAAAQTLQQATELVKILEDMNELPNLAGLYTEFSILYFLRSEYDETYRWSVEALKQVVPGLPPSAVIDVLRQASKACVVKRQLKKAECLIRKAVRIACEVFEPDHIKIADAYLDYGFFLVNNDSVTQSLRCYEKAVKIKKATFDRRNIHVAVALEDFAYAFYVMEYGTGVFKMAREYIEETLTILEDLLPPNHLKLSGAKRVKALVLEEIALALHGGNSLVDNILPNAEELLLSALKLCVETLGENNVQTAKHYGNLGRLYQTMHKYKESEEMHLKSIALKEKLLGKNDYEVGLSVGHLASLYNYHTRQYHKAEKLYLRSIDICLKLFGDGYFSLGYDYKGLLDIYGRLGDHENIAQYTLKYHHWKVLRTLHRMKERNIVEMGPVQSLSEVLDFVFKE